MIQRKYETLMKQHERGSSVFSVSIEDQAWKRDAVCSSADPDAFFPSSGEDQRAQKKICGTCPVKAQCLQEALDNDERWGIWGGLGPAERRRMRRTRAAA